MTKSIIGSAVTSANFTLVRFTAYTVGVFALTLSLPFVIEHGDIIIFKEDGPIEWFQFGVLVAASAVFLFGGWRLANFRQVFLLMAFVSIFAAIRELDGFLARAIPGIGWKVGFIVILYAAASAYRKRRLVKRQLPQFVATGAFAILWAGFLVAVPFGQLIGHGAFLELVMGDDYNRDYKRVIEETLETLGYILVLIGSLESVLQLRTAVSDPPRSMLCDVDKPGQELRVDTNESTA